MKIRPVLIGPAEEITYLCVGLSELGLSNYRISEETGLSYGQISYRLKLFGVNRRDIRNGDSKLFNEIRKKYWKQIDSSVFERAQSLKKIK